MASVQTYYQLSDFENIISKGFNCSLNNDILQLIQSIADQVGSPEYVRTPQFAAIDYSKNKEKDNNYKKNKNRRRRNNQELSSEDWESIRNFEKTQIQKSEDGVDKTIDEIRKIMNKITDKNYDTLILQLKQQLTIISSSKNDEYMLKTSETLFKITCSNNFYSSLYAKLYSELLNDYMFLNTSIQNSIEEFKKSYKLIKYFNPDTDYDSFCNNNKLNQERRTIGKLLFNLYRLDIIDTSSMNKIIEDLFETINNVLTNKTKNSEIFEELIELAYEIISVEPSIIEDFNCWELVYDTLKLIADSSIEEYPSLTHRAKFKVMDIQDHICDFM